jgi:hypothetical protein
LIQKNYKVKLAKKEVEKLKEEKEQDDAATIIQRKYRDKKEIQKIKE